MALVRSVLAVALAAVAVGGVGCSQEQGKSSAGPAKPAHAATPVVAEAMDSGMKAEALPELAAAPEIPKAPEHLPAVEESKDNPTTKEKAELGYLLFFDKRLSKDDSMACAGCHFPEKSFTDGRALSPKVGGAMNTRNAPTLLNVAYGQTFYWDGRMPTLEKVCGAAWKGQLGAEDKAAIAAKLNKVPKYRAHFQRAFKADATADNVEQAMAAFLRGLKSGDAPWDKFEDGDKAAVSKDAQKGFEAFKNNGCTLCHVPPLYTDQMFHNVGVGADKPEAERDHGQKVATKDDKDEGKFKTPSLRDIADSGPYFHDGSVATLAEAVDFMANGGKKNPNLDQNLKPHKLKPADKKAILAFIESLKGQHTYTAAPAELP
ncbi:MAG TPA: cytochrome c peroxidase [Myxococcaceae bacterium]|jgi:cytochrome c peroxidase